jgi:hypothetical protein
MREAYAAAREQACSIGIRPSGESQDIAWADFVAIPLKA